MFLKEALLLITFAGEKKKTFCLKRKNERKSQKIWAKVTTYLTPGA